MASSYISSIVTLSALSVILNGSEAANFFKQRINFRRPDSVFATFTVSVDLRCGSLCVKTPGCNSYNVGPATNGSGERLCDLLRVNQNSTTLIVSSTGWTFYLGKNKVKSTLFALHSKMRYHVLSKLQVHEPQSFLSNIYIRTYVWS